MANISEVMAFCDKTLRCREYEDYAYNGLQVPGKESISKIALGVSASQCFLEEAVVWGADLCIVHHGLFWGKTNFLNDILASRLRTLLTREVGLAAFHLPLDAHETLGNNIAIAELLGLSHIEPCDIGYIGNLREKVDFSTFVRIIEESLGSKAPFAENFGTSFVSRIAIISGGASDYSLHALKGGADTFVFGELKESSYHELKERGLNFIAAGHFATERLGVQRLGKAIQKEFPGTEIRFFDEEVSI